MHTLFDISTVKWSDFFQEGGGPYFEGVPYQRGFGNFSYVTRQNGAGLGSIFRSFMRYLLPMAKHVGKTVSKEGLETGARILHDIAGGQNVKEAVVTESKQGLRNVSNSIKEKMARDRAQRGKGRRRRRGASRKKRPAPKRSVSRKAKRKKLDSLGFY